MEIEERQDRALALRGKPLRFRNLGPVFTLSHAKPLVISKIQIDGYVRFEGHADLYDPRLFEEIPEHD
jgi:hypothetical protein